MFLKAKSTYDWLVVGLGNPGLQYENTRHNAGFMAVDKICDDNSANLGKLKFDAQYGEFKLKDSRIMIIKPHTYMNNSGKAVSKIASFYKITTERIIIIQDDVSLDVGKLRIRRKGSDGGQKGVRDIIELLGTDEIMRIKIGVGSKPHPDYDMANWVLGKIPREQREDFDKVIEKASKAVKEIIVSGIDSAMNKFSS